MMSSGPPSSIPVSWLNKWYAGPEGENIAQAAERLDRPERPALAERGLRRRSTKQLQAATSMEEAQELLIAINDIVIGEVAFIPIILRPFFNAVSNRLRVENIGNENGYASPYWNIANWNLAEGQ